MTLGTIEIDAVVAELADALAGAVLSGVDALPGPAVRIRFQTPSGTVRVRISARPRMARLHLDTAAFDARKDADEAPDGVREFAARVGTQLRGAHLVSVRRLYRDRVVGLEFQCEPHPRQLVFECSGQHPNLFLLDDHGVIRASLEPSHSLRRDLKPGSRYVKPLAHEHDAMEAMRFINGPVSAGIAALYGAEEEREERARAASEVRAALKGRMLHEERRAASIGVDLARAREAAAAVEAGEATGDRALRLAGEVQRLEARETEAQGAADRVRKSVMAIHENETGALEEARRFLRQTAPLPPPRRDGGRDPRDRPRPDDRGPPRGPPRGPGGPSRGPGGERPAYGPSRGPGAPPRGPGGERPAYGPSRGPGGPPRGPGGPASDRPRPFRRDEAGPAAARPRREDRPPRPAAPRPPAKAPRRKVIVSRGPAKE